jgi:hypothetical protein
MTLFWFVLCLWSATYAGARLFMIYIERMRDRDMRRLERFGRHGDDDGEGED